MSMKKIRIGLIGCGTIGRIHAGMIHELDNFELAAVADTNPALTEELVKKYGCSQFADYREMLKSDGIDMVSVCVPPAMHYQVVIDAAGAGKHVAVEKPMDVILEHADRMIEECSKYGVMLSVISQHRFDNIIVSLKKAVESGRLGRLLMGTARTIWYRDMDYYKGNSWRGTFANGGGALMNQSIHYIDLLQYLMGDVEAVSATCKTLLHKSIEVEDTGIAVLKFKNGAVGTIEGTTVAYPGLFSELNIYGENGTVSIKNDKLDFYKIKDGTIPEFDELAARQNTDAAAVSKAEDLDTSSHKKQYEDIARALNENRKPMINGEEGRKALAIVNAIYEASEKQCWITVK